jgi:5,5'-dehydrodivanillate O-demethylase
MLTAEQNDELTQVGPARAWARCCAATGTPSPSPASWPSSLVKRVELLGEFFALWRQPSGRWPGSSRSRPHRKASLAYGACRGRRLRCPYHGWKFDPEGACIDQPAERDNTNFTDRVRATAGKVEEMGGLIWAYVGPDPAPLLPR